MTEQDYLDKGLCKPDGEGVKYKETCHYKLQGAYADEGCWKHESEAACPSPRCLWKADWYNPTGGRCEQVHCHMFNDEGSPKDRCTAEIGCTLGGHCHHDWSIAPFECVKKEVKYPADGVPGGNDKDNLPEEAHTEYKFPKECCVEGKDKCNAQTACIARQNCETDQDVRSKHDYLLRKAAEQKMAQLPATSGNGTNGYPPGTDMYESTGMMCEGRKDPATCESDTER